MFASTHIAPLARNLTALSAALALVALFVAGGPAAGEPPRCSDPAVGELLVDSGRLRVATPGSTALRVGDELRQLNGHLLQDCSQLKVALSEARERKLDALLLIGRDGLTQTVVLTLEAATEDYTAPGPEAELAQPVEPAVAPVALGAASEADASSVRQMAEELLELGQELQGRLPLLTAQPWVKRIDELRDVYRTRKQQVPVVGAAEDIVGSYETVGEILLYKEETARASGERVLQPGLTLEFTSDSRVGGWLRRHPFLEPSIVQPPSEIPILARGERAGRWLPDTAVRLLVEHAVAASVELASANAR